MAKVLQIANFKNKVRENDLADELGGEQGDSRAGQDEKVFGKDKGVEKLDPFFVEAAGSGGEDDNQESEA